MTPGLTGTNFGQVILVDGDSGTNAEFRVQPSMRFRVVDEWRDGDTARFTVVVPEDCPFFDGHFPGRPILPAIGQLAMLTELLRRVTAAAVSLTGVDGLRLSRQVLPGDEVAVRLDVQRVSGTARFEIRSDGSSVSRGTVRMATGAGR